MQLRGWISGSVAALAALMAAPASAAPSYPEMAPVAQYRMASPAEEIALARTAAPPSISADAEILVLGAHGYETAVKGKNGFVCFVERSWDAGVSDPEFWNPKRRGPDCLNAAAVRSVLPHLLERTQWALAGVSKDQMAARIKAEIASNNYVLPEPGSVSYMLSKDGYLSDNGGHWHPHLMFFVANADAAAWGANLAGSPIIAARMDPDPVTIFMIPVTKWSDGTHEMMSMK